MILTHKFINTIINTTSLMFDFKNLNQVNQMLMDANAKFQTTLMNEIFHFCDILNESSRVWKYASFEGV